jgi:hypothetical protein
VQQAFVRVGASRAVPRFALTATALPGAPAALARVGAAPLRGRAGRPLPGTVAIRVTDGAGNPIPGVAVMLRAANGSVADHAPTTDSLGRVTVGWTLGPAAGPQRLTALVAGSGRALELMAEAGPGTPASATLESVPASGTAGRLLPKPVAVAVADSFGNAVAGALVLFSAKTGKVTPSRVRTDDHGRAAVRWSLGSTPGEQRLEVTVQEGGARAVANVRAVPTRKGRRP